MLSKVVYVASPYNHSDDKIRLENYNKVAKLSAKLVAEGNVVISPIAYGHTLIDFYENFPYDWEFWENFCLSLLSKSDELLVYKMNGWNKSRGVLSEIEFANKKNIPITYMEYQKL
jgi:hypothetical protein